MKHCYKIIFLSLFFLLNTQFACHAVNSQSPLKKITIIVPSTDSYHELWEPHFHFLFKYWPELQTKQKYIPINLVSNKKKYQSSRVKNILVGEDKGWSDNLIIALKNVQTKYVIILFEDYIFNADVDTNRLSQIINFMDKTNGAYTELALDPSLNDGPPAKGINDIIIRLKTTDAPTNHKPGTWPKIGQFRTALQACIWKTSILKNLLHSGESAWNFEIDGSKRSEEIKEPFYLVTKKPVFQYLNASGKGKYRTTAINFINFSGFKFYPKALPMKNLWTYRLCKTTYGLRRSITKLKNFFSASSSEKK